ncbi:MAG TPA: hypothetical protein VFN67_42025 [Polyangiales bacterium]|nr:hypothetical protein [Polyangiales bacterium]
MRVRHREFVLCRALMLGWLCLAGCSGCDKKTPVPFKRVMPDAGAARDAGAAAQAAAAPEAAVYPDGTHEVMVGKTRVTRGEALIHATLTRDLDRDREPDILVLMSVETGEAFLELQAGTAVLPKTQLALKPPPIGSHCRTSAAKLAALSGDLGLASVNFLCEAQTEEVLAATTLPDGTPVSPLDLPPPEPREAFTLTEQFVFTLTATPQLQLRLTADFRADEPVSPDLQIASSDLDGDQVADVQVTFPVQTAESPNGAAPALTLSWLGRSTGLAREHQQPEASLAKWAEQAQGLLAKKPKEAGVLALQTLALHRLLCRESGGARLWIDDTRGITCGASAAAGRALAISAIANAKQHQLLPALDARAQLQKSAFTLDKKTRDLVNQAIGQIRGDTNYTWYQGPLLRPGSTPNLRLPALGFSDENTLLLRGPTPQTYDLLSRTTTVSGAAGGLLATDSTRRFALTDILRGCDGLHVRIVPANHVVGGIVTGAPVSEPLLQPEAGPEAVGCVNNSARMRSERGGFELLGLNAQGALFGHGKHLWLLPLNAEGAASGAAREIKPGEAVPPLLTPGALDPSARYMALATSEGVALIDRTRDSARLIRTPASCAGGTVSDAVLSPSASKLAMLCSGRIYVAEPAATSGAVPRPTSEHP